MVTKHDISDIEEESMQKKSKHMVVDTEQERKPTNSKTQTIKWTDDENAALLRLKDTENKSWNEIADSKLFNGRSKHTIQLKYASLKEKERPSITIDDEFRDLLWDFWKTNKGTILKSLKDDIKEAYEDDVFVFPKTRLEALFVQVLSARVKQPK